VEGVFRFRQQSGNPNGAGGCEAGEDESRVAVAPQLGGDVVKAKQTCEALRVVLALLKRLELCMVPVDECGPPRGQRRKQWCRQCRRFAERGDRVGHAACFV
jgi:hypothetical protein